MAEKIVIADDNRNIRMVVKMEVESLGYEVIEASDGRKALEAIRKEKPDLVILDVMMPEMDGYEVCDQVKKDPELSATPIILLTAKTAQEDKYWGRQVGAVEYLTKPYDPDDLEKAITRILSSRRKGEAVNPLTSLPMWQAVKNEIGRRVGAGEKFLVLEGSFDQDSFDVFQQKYGNIRAEEALRATGEILKEVAGEQPGIFLGHSGDNIFFLIAAAAAIEKSRAAIDRKLSEAVPLLYDDHDREQGGIVQPSSSGDRGKTGFIRWRWQVRDL